MNLKIAFDSSEEFDVKYEGKKAFLNDLPETYSIKEIGENEYLFYYENKVYQVEVLKKEGTNFILNINGQELELSVKDHITQILEKLGMDLDAEDQVDGVNAPMPGSILKLLVEEGAEVKKGDTLLILEAMKMENVIKSPVDAKITQVHVQAGDNVEKNARLLSF